MKAILTTKGIEQCFNVTPFKVYNIHQDLGGMFEFRNDKNVIQSLGMDSHIPIPTDSFVGFIDTDVIPFHQLKITEGKPYILGREDPFDDKFITKGDDGNRMNVPEDAVVLIGDPHGVLSETECKALRGVMNTVESQKYPAVEGYVTPNVTYENLKTHNRGFVRLPVQVNLKAPAKLYPKYIQKEPVESDASIIKKQKYLAGKLLDGLSMMDGEAIIAGGAPRNWWFGFPANDLDFYLRIPKGFHSQVRLLSHLKKLGITDVYNMATHNPDGTRKKVKETKGFYANRMEGIDSVFEGSYSGQKVQIIFLRQDKKPTAYIENDFDTSISMIYGKPAYAEKFEDPYGIHVTPTNKFNQGKNLGCIFVYPNRSQYEGNHLKRIADYFPEFPLVSHKHTKELTAQPLLMDKLKQTYQELENLRD